MTTHGSIVGLEWLNQNALRRYPFYDLASLRDTTDSFSLPDELVVDFSMGFQVFSSYRLDRFHLFELSVFGSGFVLTIGYTAPGDTFPDQTQIVGTLSVSSANHTENTSYRLTGFPGGNGAFANVIGTVTIGSIANTVEQGGVYRFSPEAGRLLPTVLHPSVECVSDLYVVNDDETVGPISGTVTLVAGNNMEITYEAGTITFNAIDTSGFTDSCDCVSAGGGDRDIPDCIRTINGVIPAAGGNIELAGTACINFESIGNGLLIEDTCTEPCCTNDELNKFIEAQSDLSVAIQTQLAALVQLEARVVDLGALADAIAATGFIIT